MLVATSSDLSHPSTFFAGGGRGSADPPGANETEAVSSGLPVPNPFDDVAGEAPLEAELREMAARNSGIQLTEMYQIHTDTPARLSLAALTDRRSTKIRWHVSGCPCGLHGRLECPLVKCPLLIGGTP